MVSGGKLMQPLALAGCIESVVVLYAAFLSCCTFVLQKPLLGDVRGLEALRWCVLECVPSRRVAY